MIAVHAPDHAPDAPTAQAAQRAPVALLPAVASAGPLVLDTVYCADVMTYLKALPDESVNCVVTSPPYFGLRDYGVTGQIGLEPTPAAFVATMVAVFREVRRVLRADGVAWVNLGDSYVGATSQHRDGGSQGHNSVISKKTMSGIPDAGRVERNKALYESGLQMKQLLGIPWRVAFALQDDGWYLRADVIWHKPNPMPESVTDRPTKAHEYVFMLTRSPSYWYDAEAIREKTEQVQGPRPFGGMKDTRKNGDRHDYMYQGDNGNRNARSVWTIAEPIVRLRNDLTPAQRTYVVGELVKRGLL